MSQAAKTTVYFNSACPVCRSGVAWQQGQVSSCEIEWVDVHTTPGAVVEVGADLESIRERLHVRDADGRVRVGADAIAVPFGQTAGQGWLGRLMALSLIRPAMRWAYDAFAAVLYRWNRSKGRW